VGVGVTNPLQQLHIANIGRFDGGIQVDGRNMINSTGAVHTAKTTNDSNYGYFEVRNNSNQRGAYFG
jgi:hypothetical protein